MHHPSTLHRDAWVRRSTVLLLAALLVTPALAAQDFSHPDSEPAPEAALIQQANDALAASDFATALKILTGLKTQIPNNPQVLYDLGLTLEALGPETPASAAPDSKVPTAEFYYRQSIAANPLFPPPTSPSACCLPARRAPLRPAASCSPRPSSQTPRPP